MARLDKKLNLITKVELESGADAWVHSEPISREVFEQHFMVLAKTFSGIYSDGLSIVGGPRIAALLLRHNAEEMGIWEKNNGSGVKQSLMGEIVRLSNIVLPAESGYGFETIPLETAYIRNLMDREAKAELENTLVFFTLVSVMQKRMKTALTLEGLAALWETKTTLFNVTEWMRSLPISTETDDTTTSESEVEGLLVPS
jgi:hypothetical protein